MPRSASAHPTDGSAAHPRPGLLGSDWRRPDAGPPCSAQLPPRTESTPEIPSVPDLPEPAGATAKSAWPTIWRTFMNPVLAPTKNDVDRCPIALSQPDAYPPFFI